MEVKLAHDGADAVDAVLTAHLGVRYVPWKRFRPWHAPWSHHGLLLQYFPVLSKLGGSKSAKKFVAQSWKSCGWRGGSWRDTRLSYIHVGRRFALLYGFGFTRRVRRALRWCRAEETSWETASFLIVAVVKSAHATIWCFCYFLNLFSNGSH